MPISFVPSLSDRALRAIAFGVVGVAAVLEAATPAAGAGINDLPGVHGPVYEPLQLLLGLVWCPAALLVIVSRPRNPIGWMLLSVPLLGSIQNFAGAYGTHAFARPDDHLPGGALVLSVGSSLWSTALFLPLTLMVLRYPAGSLPGPRWRWIDRVAVISMMGMAIGLATSPDSVDDWIDSARPVVGLPGATADMLFIVFGLCLVLTSLVVLGNAALRTWRARGAERAQLLLLVLTGALTVACAASPWNELFNVSLYLVPIAVAVGVLRYNLLGIEVIVRRTLLYGALTALVAVAYTVVVAAVSLVSPGPASAVVAAALVAVGLLPVRQRLQGVVDVVVYGERRDPIRALTRIGASLPEDDPLPTVVSAVARSLHSPYVAVSTATGEMRAATATAEPTTTLHLPLRRGAADLGTLTVAPRDGERDIGRTDRRLLDALAVQVAAVVHAVDLGADLAVARERTVAAALAERQRLRHDLHDGLGPSLTGIGLGLEAVDASVLGDPVRAQTVVRRLRTEVATAVDDVRRILDGLRPPALDQVGLLMALQDRAASLTDRSGGRLRVRVEAPGRLPYLDPETELAAYRIAEEALNNCVRHSDAGEVVVRLRGVDDRLEVEVVDDGKGLPPVPRQGVGLESMQRRAESLGGSLAVTSLAGVSIVAQLPVTG